MFRILRTAFVDQLRRESSRPKLVIDMEKMLAAVDELSPPEIFNVRDRDKLDRLDEVFDQEIVRAIAELPDEERLALLFQAVGNLTYREISEALECPIGTVMSRLHRAKRWLRLRLAATGNSPRSWKEIRSDQRADPAVAEYRHGETASGARQEGEADRSARPNSIPQTLLSRSHQDASSRGQSYHYTAQSS
jgi:RNA polymerase sigma-70 factor (ECF subfamily)